LIRMSKTGAIGPLELGKRSIRKAYLQDDMLMYAAALAFRMFFAFIPFLIFVVALLGILRVPGFFEWLLDKAQNILSKDAVGQAKLVLGQVRHQARGGLLAFGAVVVAVWYTSVAVRSLMTALNVVFEVQEDRPARIRYPLSLLLAIGFALTIAIASALMLVGKPIISTLCVRLGFGEVLASVWVWLRWPAAILLLMVAAALTYHVLPNDEEPFRFLTSGAVLAVIVWVVASAGLHYYVLNFANYSVMYGALGAVLMLLLYFYVSAAVLLLGAEVNAVIRDASRRGGGESG
jgi:membrane protein